MPGALGDGQDTAAGQGRVSIASVEPQQFLRRCGFGINRGDGTGTDVEWYLHHAAGGQ